MVNTSLTDFINKYILKLIQLIDSIKDGINL